MKGLRKMGNISDVHKSRLENLQAWRNSGNQGYSHNAKATNTTKALQETHKDLENEQETNDTVTVTGRVMAVRNSGMFIDLQDHTGRIQVFSHKANASDEELQKVKRFDLGDIISVSGKVRRTKRGELTINTASTAITRKTSWAYGY